MTRKEFEELVQDVLAKLPQSFKDRLHNVAIVIEEGTGKGECTGFYEGVPLTERKRHCDVEPPAKITLFKRKIEADCKSRGLSVPQEVKKVILHEIAHHFGIDDDRLEDLGAY